MQEDFVKGIELETFSLLPRLESSVLAVGVMGLTVVL